MSCPKCGEPNPTTDHACPVWQFLGPDYTQSKTPYSCPVCNGRGHVGCGFYDGVSTSTANEKCRSCNGTGVLWGRND